MTGDTAQVIANIDSSTGLSFSELRHNGCLINVAYTINEPAARGAYTALEAAGCENDVLVVSVDGGSTGIEALVAREIAATLQEYPLKMAQMGVEAVVNYARTGEKPTGKTDIDVTLITDSRRKGSRRSIPPSAPRTAGASRQRPRRNGPGKRHVHSAYPSRGRSRIQ